jgi:hypothetical protein
MKYHFVFGGYLLALLSIKIFHLSLNKNKKNRDSTKYLVIVKHKPIFG